MTGHCLRKDHHLVWLDGFNRDKRGHYRLDAIHKYGRRLVREAFAFSDVPGEVIGTNAPWLHRVNTCVESLVCYDLQEADAVLYPKELFECFTSDIEISNNHAIYKIDGAVSIYIPAILLIRHLFMGNRLLDQCLLLPGGIDRLGAAHVDGDAIIIYTSPMVRVTDVTARVARILAWLMTNHDARLAHASILSAARSGQIALECPPLSIEGWAHGIDLDPGLLAFQLHSVDIRLPLSQQEIVVHVGDKIRRFSSYSPPQRSPWSQTIPCYNQVAGEII